MNNTNMGLDTGINYYTNNIDRIFAHLHASEAKNELWAKYENLLDKVETLDRVFLRKLMHINNSVCKLIDQQNMD